MSYIRGNQQKSPNCVFISPKLLNTTMKLWGYYATYSSASHKEK